MSKYRKHLKRSAHIMVRVDPLLKEALESMAAVEKMSLSEYVWRVMDRHVEARLNPAGYVDKRPL